MVMTIAGVVALVGGAALGAPFSEFLRWMISAIKKLKDFKPLLEDLKSTMEVLLPVLKELDLLQERLDPSNSELNFLVQTMLRADKMVRKCSNVWKTSRKIDSYTKEIQGINKDLSKFCDLKLPLIHHKYLLQHRLSLKDLNIEESPKTNISIVAPPVDEAEQWAIWESFKEKCKEKQIMADRLFALALQEDEQLAVAIQESLNKKESLPPQLEANIKGKQLAVALHESVNKKESPSPPREVISKGKQVKEDEQLIVALHESLESLSPQLEANSKRKQVKEDEQLAVALQESLNMEESLPPRLEASSYISARASYAQQAILESIMEEGKGKQVKEDEQLALALQEILNEKESRLPPLDEDEIVKQVSLREVEAEHLASALRESEEEERKRTRALKEEIPSREAEESGLKK